MITIDSNTLQKFYIAYFGRPGDPSGLNYWISESKKKSTLRDISKQLSLQDEYQKYISEDTSIELKINKLFFNLYGRKADFESLNYWAGLLKTKNYLISDIVCQLLFEDSKSDLIDCKQLEKDSFILENKISMAELFTKQISGSITLMNLYQPESINPWISGKALVKVSTFFNHVLHQKFSIDDINALIQSFSETSVEMLTKPAIEMQNISLSIPVYCPEHRLITKRFANKVINITGGKLTESKKGTNIIALNNINLTITNGERVALIGHNGSGKSSFLRLISGIYQPTNGDIKIYVDVYPMLHKTFLTSSELTGIDACKAHYLLRKHSLNGFPEFLDEIIDFSGLGEYISLPIKTYSEGMAARLIFSILTSFPHDCLAIDEGFGTGDSDFFERAEERMKKFMDSAATIFLASHSEELLKKFCQRGIVFNHGSIVYDGPLDSALNYYHTYDYYQENVTR
tara:strand:- start:43 stop:1419 length:1377 start_codon:yes stop_codon:yes gene_type:complete